MTGDVPNLMMPSGRELDVGSQGLTFAAPTERAVEAFAQVGGRGFREVYVSAQSVFDYRKPEHVQAALEILRSPDTKASSGETFMEVLKDELQRTNNIFDIRELEDMYDLDSSLSDDDLALSLVEEFIADGYYQTLELATVSMSIQRAGFDAFYVTEDGFEQLGGPNIALFRGDQLKSADNIGDFRTLGEGETMLAVGRQQPTVSILEQGDFDQAGDAAYDEGSYRPEVVAWAKEQFGGRVAPNGQPIYQNFVAWFGDSELVDAQGRPQTWFKSMVGDTPNMSMPPDSIAPELTFAAPTERAAEFFATPETVLETLQDDGSYRPETFPPSSVRQVYISAKNVFDYRKPEHAKQLQQAILGDQQKLEQAGTDFAREYDSDMETGIEEVRAGLEVGVGYYQTLELATVTQAIVDLGFDAFYVAENDSDNPNIALTEPQQLKSVDNVGDFSASEVILEQRELGDPRYSDPTEGKILELGQDELNDAGVDPRLRQTETVDEVSANVPEITLQDLVGITLFPTIADRTASGRTFTGIDGTVNAVEIPLLGGPFFPLRESNMEARVVWANRGAGVTGAKAKKLDAGATHMLVVLGSTEMHASNTTVSNAFFTTMNAFVRDKRMTKKNAKQLARLVREAGVEPAPKPQKQKLTEKQIEAQKQAASVRKQLRQFPLDITDVAKLHAYLDGLTFEARKRVLTIMGSKAARDLGAPNMQKILDATIEPSLAGARKGDGVLVVQIDQDAPFVTLGEEGTQPHPDFPLGIRGTLVGRLREPINYELLYDDWVADFWQRPPELDKNGNPKPKNQWRSFELGKPSVTVTQDLVDRVGDTRQANVDSPRQAMLAQAMIDGDWRDTTMLKKDGGASPATFVDEVAATPNRDPIELRALTRRLKGKDKDLRLFQLGPADSRIWFALNDDGTIESLVNNEVGAPGLDAASVLRAIEEGATRVVVDEDPAEIEFYEAFGFTVQPSEAGQQPGRVTLEWSGSDEQRAGITRRYLDGRFDGLVDGRAASNVQDAQELFLRADREAASQGGPAEAARDPAAAESAADPAVAARARSIASGIEGLAPAARRNLGLADLEQTTRELFSEELEPEPSPVADEDALVVLHRIEPKELEASLDLGGLAVPSIGVTKAANPYQGFGNVVLLGTEQLVDPERGTPVFMGDAYTMPFPESFRPVKPQKRKRLRQVGMALGEAEEQISSFGGFGRGQEFIDRSIDRDQVHRASEEFLRDNPAAALVWLRETFPDQFDALPRTEPRYTDDWSNDKQLQDWFQRRRGIDAAAMDPMDMLVNVQAGSELHFEVSSEIVGAARRRKQQLIDAGLRPDDVSVRDLEDSKLIDPSTGLVYLNAIERGRNESEIHYGQTYIQEGTARDVMNRNRVHIDKWIDDFVADVAEDESIYVGKRLMPLTLDNVVAAMTKSLAIANKEVPGASMSFGNARAMAGKVRDMRDLLAQRSRIDEDLEQQQSDELRPQIAKWQGAIRAKNDGGGFQIDDQAMSVLGEIVKRRKPTLQHVKAAMKKHGLSAAPEPLTDAMQKRVERDARVQAEIDIYRSMQEPAEQTLQTALDLGMRMRAMAVKYLEAKPQRAVRFNEFRGAIVPKEYYNMTPEQLKQLGARLESHGVQVFYGEQDNSVLDVAKQLEGRLQLKDGERILFDEEQQNDPKRKTTRRAKYVRRQIGNRVTRTIVLMEDRNLSSIYHELGHVFFDLRLDALRRQLANPDGPQSQVLRDTMMAFFEAMGVGPENGTIEERMAAWDAMSEREQTPYHEAIARNFEIYLSQGRAPTRQQKRLFQRLRAFMVSVYTNVAQRVNEIYQSLYGRPLFELTPEVQGAFDRMVAAESDIQREINRMRENTGEDLPGVDDREDRTDEEGEETAEQLEAEARDDAVDELQRQLLEDQQMLAAITAKATSQIYAEERRARRELKTEVKDELRRKRIHRLRVFLRSGELTDNDGDEQVFELFDEEPVEDKPKANTKLNSEQVRKVAPDIKLTELGGAMTSPQGLDVSVVADLFGYDSVLEMIEDLRSSQTLDQEVEAVVQQRMLEQYGNLATPEAVRDAVQMAIFNETRQRAVLARMKEATGLALPEDVTLQAARDIARDRVSKLALRDMLPAKFQGDAMRARREAFRHLKKGDNARAAQAFRAELLYNAMVREAGTQKNNAKQRIKQIEQSYALGREAQLAKQRDMRFIYVGRQLLNMIGLGPNVERSDEQVNQLREYDPEFFIAHMELLELMRRNSVDNVLDLTGEQLQMALDMIQALYDRSRTSRQITIAGRQMDRDEVAQQLAQQLLDSGKASSSMLTDQTTEQQQKSWKWAERRAQMKRLEQAMMVLDGGQERGPFSRAIYDLLQQPQQEADKVLAQLFERLEGLMKLVQNLQSTAPREIAAPELGGYIFGLSRKGDNGSIHELVTLIANLGNVSNRDRLMAGFRWSEKDADGHYSIEPVLRFLNRLLRQGVITRDVFDLAQGIMDTFELIKPRFQQALMEVEGRYVREIQAEPFTVIIDGEPVTFAGGYVPMRYDPEETVVGRKQEDDQRASRAALNLSSSAAQERTVNPGEVVSLRLDSLLSTFQQHVRYAYVVPSVKRVRDLLQASNVQDVVGMDRRVPLGTLIRRMNPGLYGGSANSVIELALYRAATGTLHPALAQAGPWSSPLSTLRRRVGSIIFSGNIKNALENFGALNTVLFSSLGLRWRYVLANWNGRYTRLEEMRTESPQMYNRMMKGAQQIVAESFTPATLKEKLSARAAYLAPRVTQQMLEGMVWGAAKDQWLAEMRPDGISDKQAIEQAADFANSKVRNNLGSGDLLDAPAYEGAYGELGRFLTSFTGWFAFKNQQFQLIWERFKNESGLARYGQFAIDVLAIHYLEFLFGSVLTAWLYGEEDLLDDEEKLEAMLIEAAIFQPIRMAMAAAVPIAGDMAGGAVQLGISKVAKLIDEDLDLPSGRGVEAPRTGAFDFLAQRARTVLKALEGEYEGAQLRAAVELAAILLGYDAAMLPAMAGRQLEYGADVMLGNTEPQSAEDVLRGVTTGRQPDNR